MRRSDLHITCAPVLLIYPRCFTPRIHAPNHARSAFFWWATRRDQRSWLLNSVYCRPGTSFKLSAREAGASFKHFPVPYFFGGQYSADHFLCQAVLFSCSFSLNCFAGWAGVLSSSFQGRFRSFSCVSSVLACLLRVNCGSCCITRVSCVICGWILCANQVYIVCFMQYGRDIAQCRI